ncbi:hypothetical protein NE237_032329 [Protea cynaroides]|uniref:Uncharacterized protein n=1 Tax=Protea cynaroides TaxID=273540 RepID=A0A9Q0R3C9_9MAGN|nr:hypothetical protein NE237_032329 [Protea cynaroides]
MRTRRERERKKRKGRGASFFCLDDDSGSELSSPYGNTEKNLASYFFQTLFYRIIDSWEHYYHTFTSASDKTCSFDSTRKMLLKFQEVSPWITFGHVACNGAILEALKGAHLVGLLDIAVSTNQCQYLGSTPIEWGVSLIERWKDPRWERDLLLEHQCFLESDQSSCFFILNLFLLNGPALSLLQWHTDRNEE